LSSLVTATLFIGANTVSSAFAVDGSAFAVETSGVDGSRPFVQAEVWGACGWRDAATKTVRTFMRHRGVAAPEHVLRGGPSRLLCGNEGQGYRHVLKRHRMDWEYDAQRVGSNWRDHADWAIETTLADPDKVTYRPENDSYCYSRVLQLWDTRNRRHIDDKITNVAVKAGSGDIITAFPGRTHCR
jgi:hypothetical protein